MDRESTKPGRVGLAIVMWLLGVPVSVILLITLLRGC